MRSGSKPRPFFNSRRGYIFGYEANLPIDYDLRLRYKLRQPRSLRACSRDDPECGARRGVLRRRLVTVRPGGSGPRPPGTTTWVRGARCNRSGANAGEASAAPEPKTATVERREASVPRHSKLSLHGAPYRSTCLGRTHWNPAIISTKLYCVLYGSAPIFRTPTGHRS